MTSPLLNFGRDAQGYNAYAPEFAPVHFSATLASATPASFTVTGDYKTYIVSFSYQPGTSNWVALNTTATIPVGGTFASTASELNPGARWVSQGDVISLVTHNTTADVGVSIYGVER